MKQCFRCKINKPENEFHKNKAAGDGLYTYCKVCHNSIMKKWQKENKELCNTTRKRAYIKKRKFVTDYKKKSKCCKCGEGHLSCLVFHHRNPKEKDFYIGCSIMGKGMKTIINEIAKCDVLCANCHAKLHYYLKKK